MYAGRAVELLTGLVEHLVAFVKNEVLQAGEAKFLVPNESVDPARCSHDDMGVGILVGEDLDVLLHRGSSVEDGHPDARQELGEAIILILDLVRQLTSMAHNQDRGSTGFRVVVHLLQSSQNEHGGFSETGFGLAQDIVA